MKPRPRGVRLAAALAALVVSLVASASAHGQVSSGSLGAAVSADPWRLTVSDGSGNVVLTEHPGQGLGPTGTLGFRTAAGWFHATRVASGGMSGGEYTAQLETTSPLHGISVRVAPAGEGVVSLTASLTGPAAGVEAMGIGFVARPGERFLGFGERSNAVDQRGSAVENFVADGPWLPADRPFAGVLVPPQGFGNRDDSTYFPMPWLLSTAGYGVLLDNAERSVFRLASEDAGAWSMEAEATTLNARFVAGPSPAEAVQRLTGLIGRQPAPASPWVFGPWYQATGSDRLGQAADLRAQDVPVSALQTYLHYLPCGDQQGVEAQQPQNTANYHGLGLAVTTYFNPMICTSYAPAYGQAAAAGALTENQLGQPYVYPYTGSTVFQVSQFDFSSQAGRSFYAGLLSEAVGHGYDGWMEDFGEYTPADSQSANGMSGTEMHNLYPKLYHCASWDYAKTLPTPPVAFIRSGWTGVHPCAQVVWGGDPSTEWGFDGLQSSVKQALSLGTSGISRWGSDIGGFFQITGEPLSPELLARWIQFGAVSGVMRTQANGFSVGGQTRPQIFDPGILPVWRRYAKLRTQLYPYLVAADAEYRRTGMPLMRHHALTHPADPSAVAREDQFMFGPDLLAAPVHDPGATSRSLHLPAGTWIDFWRAISYEPGGGGLALGRAAMLDGGGERAIAAPLDELPMMVRAGAVLPFLPEDVDTLASYGSDSTVRLDENPKRLELIAFPRGKTTSRFGESGVLTSEEFTSKGKSKKKKTKKKAKKRKKKGKSAVADTAGKKKGKGRGKKGKRKKKKRGKAMSGWRLTIDGAPAHAIGLEASLTTSERPLRPCRVKADGKLLGRKLWSVKDGVLRVSFTTPSSKPASVVVLNGSCKAKKKKGKKRKKGKRGPKRK